MLILPELNDNQLIDQLMRQKGDVDEEDLAALKTHFKAVNDYSTILIHQLLEEINPEIFA